MEEYQQRVVDEQTMLDAKIIKLREFIADSVKFTRMHIADQALLRAQLQNMTDYSATLGLRIARFR